MAEYEMQSHWTGVRESASAPTATSSRATILLYYHYKAAQFAERFLPRRSIRKDAWSSTSAVVRANLRWMSEHRPARLVGCDQATEMVRLAKQNAPSAEVVQIDGEKLPLTDGEFGLVTTVTVLQHNPDRRRVQILSEICRVSNDEVLLFEDTSLRMPVHTGKGQGQYQNFFGRPVAWYAGVCNVHGFDLVETQYLQTKVSLKIVPVPLGSA